MDLLNLIGFILPPFIDLINLKVKNTTVKFWVAMGFCVLVGVVVNLDKLKSPQELLGGLAIVFTTAQVTYHTYWEKSDARQALEKRL